MSQPRRIEIVGINCVYRVDSCGTCPFVKRELGNFTVVVECGAFPYLDIHPDSILDIHEKCKLPKWEE